MSQFRLARLCLMLAALGAAPALMNNAFAQKDDKAAAEQKGPTIRPELFKLIDPTAVKALMDAKNYAEVQNRVSQAEALPNRTPFEDYAINRMKLSLAVGSGNDAAAIPALASVIDSGFLNSKEKDGLVLALGNMYYNGKNWPKAIEVFKRYQKEGAQPENVRGPLIRAAYLSGDYAGAKADLLPMIAETEKAGKAPSEEDLRLLASSGNKLKDEATYLLALEKLVAYYPSDDFWTDVLNRGVQRKPGFDAQANEINVFRLEHAAVQKMAADEYSGFAELLLAAGFPAEAKKVLDGGFANGVLNTAKQRQLRDKATKAAADDAKSIAGGEASAAKSKNGAGLVNIGWAYVTMEQFDKGIGYIKDGIAKGGLKQPDEAKLRLGIAQVRAGKKDEAVKTFQEIKAGAGLSDLAKYWLVLVNHPTAATVAAK